MTRARTFAAFLLAVLLPLALAPVAADASAAPGAATRVGPAGTPLTVRLARLSPAEIPRRGRIVLAGWVRNDSAETWYAVNVHPFVSRTPMTTRAELAAAAATDQTSEVGTRLVDPGQFAPVGDLRPRQRVSFRISLPVDALPITGDPGVYWIGVHALGQDSAGRDNLADGRDRTFIPLVGRRTRTSVALVVPVRAPVRHDPDGRISEPAGWDRLLGDSGRLGRISDLLATGSSTRLTLLVDPAVLDAAGALAAGNPELSLGNGDTADGDGTPSPSGSPSPGTDSDQSAAGTAPATPVADATAADWLTRILFVARSHPVLGLGYADPDVNALARLDPDLLMEAQRLSAKSFAARGVVTVPAAAPATGLFDLSLTGQLPAAETLLIANPDDARARTLWRTVTGQDLVLTDTAAASGGPGPSPATSALALRQRIVSEAALRATGHPATPLVVELPAGWDPGSGWERADFFGAMQLPWLNLVGINVSGAGPAPAFTHEDDYPAKARGQEIHGRMVRAAGQLIATGSILGEVLNTENTASRDLRRIALEAVSQQARSDRAAVRRSVLDTDQTIRDHLDRVVVSGTDFATLSGGSGTVAVTVINRMGVPITVGVRGSTDSGRVRISAPAPVALAPGQRSVLRLQADATGIGVHRVTVTPVTTAGSAFGTPLVFDLRTSQVGNVIWAAMVAAGVLLTLMIIRRIYRRIREHRWRTP